MDNYYTAVKGRLVKIWFIPENISPEQIIPADVKVIGEYAFSEISDLVEIVIPEHVTEIEKFAFYKCKNLEKVTISKSVEKIGYGAFGDCINLKEVNYSLNNGFADFVFHGCKNLFTISTEISTANCFYLPVSDSFIIAKQVTHLEGDTKGCEIYIGQIADNPFPVSKPNELRTSYFIAVSYDNDHNKFCYRSTDLQMAITGSLYQSSHKSFKEFFGRTLKENSIITWKDFALLTGVCDYAQRMWFAINWPQTETTVHKAKEILEDIAPVLAQRFQQALDLQNKEFNLLDFNHYLDDKETEIMVNKTIEFLIQKNKQDSNSTEA